MSRYIHRNQQLARQREAESYLARNSYSGRRDVGRPLRDNQNSHSAITGIDYTILLTSLLVGVQQ